MPSAKSDIAMALYIQHGHGKSDKITTALESGAVGGVIFGARNEKPAGLQSCISEIRSARRDCELLFDPQFYVSTLNPPNDRYLQQYKSYYLAGRTATDFTSARRVRQFVKGALDYQVNYGLDALISPTVIFDSFSDRWHQIALNLADASLEYHAELSGPPPLLLSFVFAEDALAAIDDVRPFLDTVTQDEWNMEGFYLVADRKEGSYNQRFDSQRLAHLLYLVYVLGRINSLRVVCGYADFVGILLRAAGAQAFATGWSQSLRQFSRNSFIKRPPGGRQARERYSSSTLFNSILFESELQAVFEVGYLDHLLSGVSLDGQITGVSNPQSAGWSRALSQRHHWQTLHAMDQRLSGRVRADLRTTVEHLRDAMHLYTVLEANGVQFERNSNKDHLMQWVRAIEEFQRMAGMTSA